MTSVGCQSEKPIDTQAVKKEMASRELRKISNTQITAAAEMLGKRYFQYSSAERDVFTDSLKILVSFIPAMDIANESDKMLFEAYKELPKNDILSNLYVDIEKSIINIYGPKYEEDSLVGLLKLELPKRTVINSF